MSANRILSALLVLSVVVSAQPRVSPGFLAGVNVLGSSTTPNTGQVWIVNANTMLATKVNSPALFAQEGVNALFVATSTGTAFTGYLATTAYGTSAGDLYQFTITGITFTTLTKLNSTAFSGGNLAQMLQYGSKIYVVHQNAGGTGAVISSVPIAGGPTTIEMDLSPLPGFQGVGNAMVRFGSALYVATWNVAGQEQLWKWEVGMPTASFVKALPQTLSTNSYFGPVAMQVVGLSLVLAGVQGDLVWLDSSGNVVAHYHSGSWDSNLGKYLPNPVNSVCRFDSTSDWVFGSRDGALDVLARSHGADQVCQLGSGNSAASVTAIVSLSEGSGYTNCFADGGVGSGGFYPVQVHHGTPHLNMIWEAALYGGPDGAQAYLALGSSNTRWGSLMLPYFLDPIGAPGQPVLISQDVVLPFVLTTYGSGRGKAVAQLTIPNNAALLGGVLFTQWVVRDIGANVLGIATSNAYASSIYP